MRLLSCLLLVSSILLTIYEALRAGLVLAVAAVLLALWLLIKRAK